MSFLKKYFKIYGVLFVLGIFFVSCESICDLLLPTVSQNIIDDGIQKSDMHYVIHMGIIMFSIVAAGALFACIRNIIACTVSQKFGADLRFDLFSKIQKLSVADTDRFEGGSLVTRLTNDITQLTNFSAGLMRVIVKAPVLCIGSILMIWMNNYYMLPVFLIAVVYAFFTIFMSIHFSYPQFKKVQESIDRVNVVMREYLAGIRIVRAFGRYDYERSRFDESNSDLSHTTMKATRILAIFNPLMMLGINVSIAIIIWLSSHWINLGNMEVGQMSAAIMYMGQLLTSLTMISNFLNNFARTKASTERIGEVMSTEEDPALKDLPGAEMPETASIQFHDVCFTYPKSSGEAALTDITFDLPAGFTLGIIGSTGSGKSTLASLMMRFYEVSSGSISVSGKNISEIPAPKLRDSMALAPQTASLFTGTIFENIAWGNSDAKMEDVEKAARAAAAHEFITETENGYGTFLGQGGVNLSGGQKQRISIARALLKSPEILILDDCTSALDAITEARVKKAIKEYSANQTCIMITQRIATAMTADRILVLENGRQAGFGTHSELFQNCEIYRDIYISQIGADEERVDKDA